jgi:hypothetical protein
VLRAAALHMLVEALFWFHPLVWWLEGRLIEEREPSDPATLGHSSVEGNPRNGRFTAADITAKTLIENAYGDMHLFQIEGAPKWTDSERYDIAAKAKGFGDIDPYESITSRSYRRIEELADLEGYGKGLRV